VEAPVALGDSAGFLLLGTPAFLWAEREAFDPPLSGPVLDTAAYISRLLTNHGFIGFHLDDMGSATPVRHWSEQRLPRKIVAAQAPDGTIHIAWFTPPPGAHPDDDDTTIWYAERGGGLWSEPKVVFTADRFDWTGQKAALFLDISLSNASNPHLLVAFVRGQAGGIAHVRRIAGEWTVSEKHLGGLPSRPTGQTIAGDSIVVAYAGIGAPGVRERNGQHIFLFGAAVADTAWPDPKLLVFSGLDGIRWLKLYRPVPGDTSQALTLVWNSFRQEAGPSDTLYAMVSHDNGSTWMTPKKLPLPFVVSRIIDASDRHGNLHLAVRPRGETGKAPLPLHYVTLRHGVWGLLDSLRFGHTAVTPSLSFVAPDHLMLVWDSPRSAGINDSRVAPVSKYSLLRQGCAIHKTMRD